MLTRGLWGPRATRDQVVTKACGVGGRQGLCRQHREDPGCPGAASFPGRHGLCVLVSSHTVAGRTQGCPQDPLPVSVCFMVVNPHPEGDSFSESRESLRQTWILRVALGAPNRLTPHLLLQGGPGRTHNFPQGLSVPVVSLPTGEPPENPLPAPGLSFPTSMRKASGEVAAVPWLPGAAG